MSWLNYRRKDLIETLSTIVKAKHHLCNLQDVYDHWEGKTDGSRIPCITDDGDSCGCDYLTKEGQCLYPFRKRPKKAVRIHGEPVR